MKNKSDKIKMKLLSMINEYEKVNTLINDSKVLTQKVKEIDKKVKEYKNSLLSEITNLQNKVKEEYKSCFKKQSCGEYNYCYGNYNNLYAKICDILFEGKVSYKFLENLENNYNERFEFLTLKSKTSKTCEEWEEYESYVVDKNYYVNLIVPRSMVRDIQEKYNDIKESDLEILHSNEKVFILGNGWYQPKSWDEEKFVLEKEFDLSNVFKHLLIGDSYKDLSKINIDENLYYKNDERFIKSIFETLKYYYKTEGIEETKEDELEL